MVTRTLPLCSNIQIILYLYKDLGLLTLISSLAESKDERKQFLMLLVFLREWLHTWLSDEHRRAATFSHSLLSLEHKALTHLPAIICTEVNVPWYKQSLYCGLGFPLSSYSYSLADSNEIYWSCKTQEKLLPVGKSFANVTVFYSQEYTIALITTWFITFLWSAPLC